jgi:aldehyde:ferredoxin oxidoreductase
MSIGPAGENLVSFAGIVTGMGSVAGRHGLGAIMGSKNLKAVVVEGSSEIRIARPEQFAAACETAHRWLRESPLMREEAQGGAGDRNTLDAFVACGGLPLGNWEVEDALCAEVGDFRGAQEFWHRHAVQQYGCFGCPVNHFHVFNKPGVGTGTIKCAGWQAFTGNVWNDNRELMFHANHFCNDLGLDSTATGNAISFLMELHHKGVISSQDTDGIPMLRGGEEAIINTIDRIGRQQGFGTLFRDGVEAAAREIGGGAEECAMVVKGSEIEQYEVRAFKSTALIAALNAGSIAEGISLDLYALLGDRTSMERWARELYGSPDVLEPASYEKKALIVWDWENRSVAGDALGLCRWVIPWTITPFLEKPAQWLSLATGRDASEDDLLAAAQRTKTLERAFACRKGISRTDDSLPTRMFETGVPDGIRKGDRLDRGRFERMVDEYYALRGWDTDGIPTEETFLELALPSEWDSVREELEALRRAQQ